MQLEAGKYLRNAKEIIESYNQFFNKEYADLKQQIFESEHSFTNINLEKQISERKLEFEKNNGLSEFWKKYIKEE